MIARDELELFVVGTLLIEPKHMGEVMGRLTFDDFQGAGARGLFQTMAGLFLEDKPIDPTTVLVKAGDEYDELVGLILDKPYYTLQLDDYCQLLAEQSRLGHIRKLAGQLTQVESEEAAGKLVDRLNGAFVSRRQVEVLPLAEATVDFLDAQSFQQTPAYLTWGIEALDEGLFTELGDFVVIGGYPSAGKTLLSLQMALHLAEDHRVGYFSLETNPRKLTDRILAHRAQIPLAKIKRHALAQGDWDRMRDAAQKVGKLQLDLIWAGGMRVQDIRAVTLQKSYEVIFVDYLQLVQGQGRDRYEQVTSVSIGLHTLAQDCGVAVIALAQLTRPDKTGGKQVAPSMNSFRESGQIEQDADVAMLLYPDDLNDNGSARTLKVSKNKEGGKLLLSLDFDGQRQTMTPVEPPPHKKVMGHLVSAGKAAKQRSRMQTQTQIVDFQELTGADPQLPF